MLRSTPKFYKKRDAKKSSIAFPKVRGKKLREFNLPVITISTQMNWKLTFPSRKPDYFQPGNTTTAASRR